MTTSVGGKATAGGVGPTSQQTALSQYTLGENQVGALGRFAQAGNPMESTGVTQAATVGPEAKFALEQGKQSIADTAAQEAFINKQFASLAGGLGGILGSLGGGGGGGGG